MSSRGMSRELGIPYASHIYGSEPAPVDAIPVEILAEIFLWLRDMCIPDFWHFYSWCTILLVNKQWYTVAVQTTALWAKLNIAIKTPGSFFMRASQRPLSLIWAANDSEFCSLHHFKDHFPRCSTINLSSMPDDAGRRTFDGLTTLPLLENLSLFPKSGSSPLAQLFISGHFPKLTHLDFVADKFKWSYGIFAPTLRELHINASATEGNLTLSELVDALRRMPLLERLEMIDIVSDTEEARLCTSTVALNNLCRLFISGTPITSSDILRALVVRPSVNIDIRCRLPPQDPRSHRSINTSLTRLSKEICDKFARKSSDGASQAQIASPFKAMLVQQYDQYDKDNDSMTAYARLHFLRADTLLLDVHQKDGLRLYERLRSKKNTGQVLEDDFQGVQIILSWDCPGFRKLGALRLAAWPERICRTWPLAEVTTIALDLNKRTAALNIHKFCPNVTTVVARDEKQQSSGLIYLLDQDIIGRRLYKCSQFPKIETLVLDRTVIHTPLPVSRELARLRGYLQDLHIPRTLMSTLKELRVVYSFGQVVCPYSRVALKELRGAFPEIDVSLLGVDYGELEF